MPAVGTAQIELAARHATGLQHQTTAAAAAVVATQDRVQPIKTLGSLRLSGAETAFTPHAARTIELNLHAADRLSPHASAPLPDARKRVRLRALFGRQADLADGGDVRASGGTLDPAMDNGSGLRRGRATEPLGPELRASLGVASVTCESFGVVRLSKEAFEWRKNEKTSHRLMAT
jgi:hypothetical protein